jgi:hypothetical protein
VRPEGVERTERVVDRSGQLAGRLVAPVGGQVLPEDRVVDVPAEVEGTVFSSPAIASNEPPARASASLSRVALRPLT